MHTTFRSAAVAGALMLALSAAAGAATVRLVPLAGQTAGTTVNGCNVPSTPASVTAAAPADLPAIASGQNVSGITEVRIALDPRGYLTRASVLSSSGNRWIDRAAVHAAQASSFSAEVRDCARIGGEYAFVVDFTN
ncbi:MAG: hypothetical protein JWM87_924 [Candidatus Eremiobacteraeota bacterium]|nr:hypothetical protein [Candidatus Eremiobacteraeota bacterium]